LQAEQLILVSFLGAPEKLEYRIADVLHAFELGAISQKEVRKILTEAGWPLELLFTNPPNYQKVKRR
jgi:hypothetical protein